VSHSTPKYLVIASELMRSIQMGQLALGDKLPPQRQLAAQLGVTLGNVTRAYAWLQSQGIVKARPGDGTYVCDDDAASHQRASINLAFNVPACTTLEAPALQQAMVDIAADRSVVLDMLNFQSELGIARHRQAGAQWLQRLGTGGDGNRVMITSGAQNALACALRTFGRAGDTLLTEPLSYHGIRQLAQWLRLHVETVPMDDQGMLPDALEHAARTTGAKMLYAIPSLHMPTGCSMSISRRDAIAKVIRRRNLLLIEDCVFAAGQESPLPALSTWLPEQSLLVTSFSKSVAPGLRVGYVEASQKWLTKLAGTLRSDSLMVAPLQAEVVSRWITSGQINTLVAAQQAQCAHRLNSAQQYLASNITDIAMNFDVQTHAEFPFLWLQLRDRLSAGAIAKSLQTRNVLVRTGDYFHMGRNASPQALRISLNATVDTNELLEGLRAVVETIQIGSA
jgi:DNA-binding transcriptional MocR family regulator